MDSKGFLKPWKMCFTSENQISNVDFALFSLFNISLLYLGGGGPVLTPNIPVQTPAGNLFICWLPKKKKKTPKQFNFYNFLWLSPVLISVCTSAAHDCVLGYKRFTPALLLSLSVPVLRSLAGNSSKCSSHG